MYVPHVSQLKLHVTHILPTDTTVLSAIKPLNHETQVQMQIHRIVPVNAGKL